MAEDSLKTLEEGHGKPQGDLNNPQAESSKSSEQEHGELSQAGKHPRWWQALDERFNPPDHKPWNKERKDKEYGPPPAKDDRSELEIFQSLVGIYFLREGGGVLKKEHRKALGHQRPVPPMTDIFFPSATARERFRNRGLYNRCLAQDQKNRVMYGLSNYVISFLYLLQILIAAAITGLSAYEQSATVTLTVLGAINTVLAGILAWLNGQGMPTRFRRARDQYREVVKAIESAERLFSEINYMDWNGDSRPDPFKVRDDLEKMYEEARSDQESNYPDTQEGPSKNQMEGTKRVLEKQIQDQKTEKDAQVQRLQDAEKIHRELKQEHEKQELERQQKASKRDRELQRNKNDLEEARHMFKEVSDKLAMQSEKLKEQKEAHDAQLSRYLAVLRHMHAKSQKAPADSPAEENTNPTTSTEGPSETVPYSDEGPKVSQGDDVSGELSDEQTPSHLEAISRAQQENLFASAPTPKIETSVMSMPTRTTEAVPASLSSRAAASETRTPNHAHQRGQPRWLTRSLDDDWTDE